MQRYVKPMLCSMDIVLTRVAGSTGLSNSSIVITLIRYVDAVPPLPGEFSVIFWMLSRSDRLCFL